MGHYYARCYKTKLAQNKNKEFNSKRQSVKQLCDWGKSLADDSGFLFVLNARNQIERRKIFIGDVKVEILIDSGATCNILDQWFPTFFIWRHTIKLFKFLRHTHYNGNNKKVFI